MTETFLHLPEKATTTDLWSPRSWLPTWAQTRAALTWHVDQVISPWDEEQAASTNGTMTSMRQGLGLVVLAAIIGGVIPFVVNWIQAAQVGTALPLLTLARYAEQQSAAAPIFSPFTQAWTEVTYTVAGLPPSLPGWLAAGLSALGAWANWPLTWLMIWIVYGAGVLVALKLQGATNTLPHLYAATSYAFVPFVLLGLRPLPYLGVLLALVGTVWALVIYGQAVRTISHLSTPRVIVSLIAPLLAAVILGLLGLGIVALIFLPLMF